MTDWTPDDLKSALDKNGSVFLKLWKKGCGICKLSVPATDRLEAANPHSLSFARIDVDEFPEMLEIAETESLPTFFVFAGGAMKDKFIGFKGLDKLQQFVDGAMASK